MEWETALFRLFEERLVAVRLEQGFEKDGGGYDVESFISFSRSIGNRRFSRAGHAFEHHVKAVLGCHGVEYGWHVRTEGKRTPDFIFPSAEKYHDAAFPAEVLRMLGVKTSCKDRWRQIINEAARVGRKHLLTLEPGISEDQTNEMQEENVVLVVPSSIHETYTSSQRERLLSVTEFISEVKAL
jgi:hypothetical protein